MSLKIKYSFNDTDDWSQKKSKINYSIEKNNRCVILNKIYYINAIIF